MLLASDLPLPCDAGVGAGRLWPVPWSRQGTHSSRREGGEAFLTPSPEALLDGSTGG